MAWENTTVQYFRIKGARPILDDGRIEFTKNGSGVTSVKVRSQSEDLLLTPTGATNGNLEATGSQTIGGITFPVRLVLERKKAHPNDVNPILFGFITRNKPDHIVSEEVECVGEVEGDG